MLMRLGVAMIDCVDSDYDEVREYCDNRTDDDHGWWPRVVTMMIMTDDNDDDANDGVGVM